MALEDGSILKGKPLSKAEEFPEPGVKVIKSDCANCHGHCGVLVHIREGKVIKVEGDPDNPLNWGTLCPKGLMMPQLLYHSDRLKYPLKRLGKRGEGRWQRITWDEALDTAAQELNAIRQKWGPLGVAFCQGTGRTTIPYIQRFISLWGTANRAGYPHNCYTPRVTTSRVTFGRPVGFDERNSRCLMAWGSNITHTNEAGCRGANFISAWKKGAKLICVDPVFTAIASKADIWLQIRPGTDCALSLAMLNVIISEGLYDRQFVEKWIYGFDRLAGHVAPFTPEWASQITWIPADSIRRAARIYATTKPACLLHGVAPEFGVNTTNTIRSFWLLAAVTGNVDVPGGNVFWLGPLASLGIVPDAEKRAQFSLRSYLSEEAWQNRCGKEFKLYKYGIPTPPYTVYKTILTEDPYPIKALVVWTANPLLSHENPRDLIHKAFMKVDFLMAVDHWMTPSAELADIVLPAATYLERDDVHFLGSAVDGNPVGCCQKAVEPLGECRDDKEIILDLSQRLGLDYGWGSVREMLDGILSPAGITFEEFKQIGWIHRPLTPRKYELGLLRPDGRPGFNTPSGKIELYCTELEEMGYDPMPIYKEPPESPYSTSELAQEYPLVLTTGIRSPVYFHTQFRQIPWLREIHPDPIVRIHPETAQKFNIREGDWVYIESPRGRCRQKAKLTYGIDPRVVMAEHDWWFPEKEGAEPGLHGAWEANINLLVSSDPPYDPALGSTPARSLLCRIYKAEG